MPQEDSAAKHYMYVLECADGTWYTGYAVDVERHIAAHNAGHGAKYTRARRPVRLVAKAAFDTKHEAMSAEYHFKRLGRAQKELLVAQIGSAVPLEVLLVQGGLVAAGVPSGLCPSDRRPHSQKGPSPMSSSPLSADSALTVRHATPLDVDSLAALEAQCFPPAEAATRQQFVERVAAFPEHFWLLERDGELVAAINGMVTDSPTIADEMFADASLHNEAGAWQAIFGAGDRPGAPAARLRRPAHGARRRRRPRPGAARLHAYLQRGAYRLLRALWLRELRRFGLGTRGCRVVRHAGGVLGRWCSWSALRLLRCRRAGTGVLRMSCALAKTGGLRLQLGLRVAENQTLRFSRGSRWTKSELCDSFFG